MAKLKTGDKFTNYTVDSVFGTDIVRGTTIEKIMDGKPTMFWFQRYIGCPPCRLDVHLLVMEHDKFLEKGVNIVVVMQSKPEIVLRDMVDKTLPFHLICDPEEKLYKDLEIGNMSKVLSPKELIKFGKKLEMMKAEPDKYAHGDYEGNEEQAPAFFYVDKDMTVLEAHYARTIVDMPLADEALAKIK